MQLKIIYFKMAGFWGYLIPYVFSGLYLKSSDSVFFFWGNRFRLYKFYMFLKKFKVVDEQELEVDYDAYVKAAQLCLKKNGVVDTKRTCNFCGSNEIYRIVIEALKTDQDYKHLKELEANEISKLPSNKLKSFVNDLIYNINV